jgi:dolichol kinase
VKVFDALAASGALDRKLSRKLVHATAGPFLVLTWPLFSAAPHARFVAAAVPALNAARLALVGSGVLPDPGLVASVSRQGGKAELLKGPLYYVIVLSALTAVFWRDFPAPALVAVSMMCGGDGLADIVGRRLGRDNPLPWNGAKSWAGSAAMAAGGMGMALGMTAAFQAAGWDVLSAASGGAGAGGAAAGATVLVPRLLAICLACTAAESLPANSFVDDNLSVPAVAVVGSLLLFSPPVAGGGGVGAAALALAAGGVALAVGAANAVAARAEEQEAAEEVEGKVVEARHHQQQVQHHHLHSSNGNGNGAVQPPPPPSASPPPSRSPSPSRETTPTL